MVVNKWFTTITSRICVITIINIILYIVNTNTIPEEVVELHLEQQNIETEKLGPEVPRGTLDSLRDIEESSKNYSEHQCMDLFRSDMVDIES